MPIKQVKFSLSVLAITILYLLLTVYSRNSALIGSMFFFRASFMLKMKLLLGLIEGLGTSMEWWELAILLLLALLTGLTLTLVINRIRRLHKLGGVHLVAGGSSLLGIASAGCAGCGLPVLSLIGVGGSVAYLPFKGAELSFLSLVLLLISLFFLLRKDKNQLQVCEIKISDKRVELKKKKSNDHILSPKRRRSN